MFRIGFKNKRGELDLCGGSKPLLALLWVSGLSLPQKKETTATLAYTAGQALLYATDKVRDIVLAGHFYGSPKDISEAARLLYTPGALHIFHDGNIKCIDARCVGITDTKQTDEGVYYLEIAFRCDNPYFKDPTETKVEVYERKPCLKTEFTLPCLLSQRITEGDLENKGDIPAQPNLTVTNRSESVANGFEIQNRTTGKRILYEGTLKPGESVTISVPHRTIKDGEGNDKLLYLAEDCYLTEFTLSPGRNRLHFSGQAGLWCSLTFLACYVESML